MSDARALTQRERAVIEVAREKACILYEGKQVPHRSCGIALLRFGLVDRELHMALTAGLAQAGSDAPAAPASGQRGAP